jgi:hypothetical protein
MTTQMKYVASNDNIRNLLDNPQATYADDDSPIGAPKARQWTVASKAAGKERRAAEAVVMRSAIAAIAERQAIGKSWDGAANDNIDIPLLKLLKRDTDGHHIKTVIRYRALVALCSVEPLQGQEIRLADGFASDRVTLPLLGPEEVDKAAKDGFPVDRIRGGNISYKEVRKRRGTFSLPATRAVDQSEESSMPRTVSTAVRFTVNTLHDAIDSKPVLAELRAALGPLCDLFEAAVLDGQTMTEIGASMGAVEKAAGGTGRAVIMRALDVLKDTWDDIEKRERRKAAHAERAVTAARAAIIERRRAFLARTG